MTGREHDGIRAEGQRTGHGHGRVDAKSAGFVGSGGNDAPVLRPAADEQRFARQVRILQHLDGGEEGIQIQMDDGP